jgi:hypothetical protein
MSRIGPACCVMLFPPCSPFARPNVDLRGAQAERLLARTYPRGHTLTQSLVSFRATAISARTVWSATVERVHARPGFLAAQVP